MKWNIMVNSFPFKLQPILWNKYPILNINFIGFYDMAMINYFVGSHLPSSAWSDNNFETPSSSFYGAWLIRELGYCGSIVYFHCRWIYSLFSCSYLRLSTHEYIFGVFYHWTIYYTTFPFLAFFYFMNWG